MSHIVPSLLLRRALTADAVMSGGAAILLIAGAGIASSLLGLPVTLLRGAGLILIPFVALVTFLATRREIEAQGVWTVIVLNVGWVAASLLLLVSGWVAPTGLGYVFVIVQALAVAVFAELQFTGLRRPAVAAA